MAFEEILGNEKIKEVLKNTAYSNNILNAYIFYGKDGIGKLLFAKEFAKMILCLDKNLKPCNNCKSCVGFNRK